MKTAIYDGFYVRKYGPDPTLATVAPPVQIFHPVFQEFSDRINSPAFEPDEVIISIVSELITVTTEIHPSEEDTLAELRGYMGRAISTGSCILDFTVTKSLSLPVRHPLLKVFLSPPVPQQSHHHPIPSPLPSCIGAPRDPVHRARFYDYSGQSVTVWRL